jgi:cytochrome P450
LKNRTVIRKLTLELEGAFKAGLIEDRQDGIVGSSICQKLPYPDASIQEPFRLHPAAGLMLERVTPIQGWHILGCGVIVGCNAWVTHRRPEVFGKDVNVYRPEKWIDAPPKRLKEMKATMFYFGAASSTCIGKNISLLEIYKLFPSLLRRFDVSTLFLPLSQSVPCQHVLTRAD